MTKKTLLCVAALLTVAGALYAHDLFLKLSTYFLAPHTEATIALLNGTFDRSENVITRDRMQDVRIVGPGDAVVHPDTAHWREQDNTTFLDFKTGDPGTYVVGVSTRPRFIDLSSDDFNAYLEHDGVLDVLEARRRRGQLGQDARERYAKHVKAIFQVGDARTDAYRQHLGYPIEIVPVTNPYQLGVGEACEVLVLQDGMPVANQLVYASYEGYHGHDEAGGHVEAVRTRTDEDGLARFDLVAAGRWYIRLIHMVESDDDQVDYTSNWATLTFEIR